MEEVKEAIRILGELYFKVKWLNYSEETWEPMENLQGCPEKLSNFWQLNGDPVRDFAGAASESINRSFNFSNWMSTDQVLDCIKKHEKRMPYKKQISTEEFVSLAKEDKIYVLLHHAHFFVFIHLFKERRIYITDGNNTYLRFQMVQKVINPVIKGRRRITIIPIENNYQIRVDECGSSAIFAALQFRYWYEGKHGQPRLKNANRWLKNKLRKLHVRKSVTLRKEGRNRIDEIPREKCPYCGKDFSFNKRGKLAHIRITHKSQINPTITAPVPLEKVNCPSNEK